MKYLLIILLFTSCRVVQTYQYREDGSRVAYVLDTVNRHCGAEYYDRAHNRARIRRGNMPDSFWNVGIVRRKRFLFMTYLN